ncbi:MAG: hypothetical protein KGQ60_01540 [Planctomycetes bacterium]|nr:hypothetical protein [Planctomycetota bacterium]
MSYVASFGPHQSAALFNCWLGEMIASPYAHLLADPADRFANGMLVGNPFSIESCQGTAAVPLNGGT